MGPKFCKNFWNSIIKSYSFSFETASFSKVFLKFFCSGETNFTKTEGITVFESIFENILS